MEQKMTTDNAPQFVKVIDPQIAESLSSEGFSYIKEGDVFVFLETQELLAVLQRQYASAPIIIENKLRF